MEILKLCRLCAGNSGEVNIFTEEQDLKLSTKIMYCAKVSIVEGDGLPAHVCAPCEEELSAAYRFVVKCEITDKLLRELPSNNETITNPSIENDEQQNIKIEIKSEDNCISDHQNNYEDFDGGFKPLKLEHEFEEDNITVKKKLSRKKVKYKGQNHSKCNVCDKITLSPSALAIHMRSHTGETPYPCSSCNKKFKDRGNLKRHVLRNHGMRERKFICEHCGKGFFTKCSLKTHMRVHTGETPYSCSECPRKFSQMGALTRHKIIHTGDRPHACSTCGKTFTTKEGLTYHGKVHSEEKKYTCSICSLPFKYQNNLKKHMILHTTPNSFICNYCGRSFNQKGNLKSHIDRQHSEKSGICKVCSKNVPDIEVHMWKHTGQRPIKCELCSSSFFELRSLAQHTNYRHKNIDRFMCTVEGCGMKFSARSMLEYHKAKLHETGIPFPCDRCTRGFYRKNDLARHKIGTHKERLV